MRKFLISTVLAAAALLALAAAYGQWRWGRLTQARVEQVNEGRSASARPAYDEQELAALPPPVQRYFRAVLKPGQAMIAAATLHHAGSFNLSEAAPQWKPFTSEQRVVTRRPGFVWDGKIMLLPAVPVRVHDLYVAGTGVLQAALFGLVTLADMRGTDALAQGELMRYLAEAAWYPTALLPREGVQWQAVDEQSARASLQDGKVSATLLFHFDSAGLIDWVRADARGRSVNGKIVMTPWEGRWADYALQGGLRVPIRGEVAWLTPEGRRPYWRGEVKTLRYELSR